MRFRLFIGLLLCVYCAGSGFRTVSAQDGGHKNILIISSYFPMKQSSNQLITSFNREISGKINCKVSVEYMDSESDPEFGHWIDWMQLLFNAYPSKPDAVVILGGEAWSAYSNACTEQWKDIPVILGCVKKGYIDYRVDPSEQIRDMKELRSIEHTFAGFKVTGYYIKDYFPENLALIRRLQPPAAHVVFMYDNRYGFQFFTPYLDSLVRSEGFKDLQALYGNKLTTRQLTDTLLRMDDTYALLSAGWYTDVNHYPHAYSMLHNELGRYPSKYLYQILDEGFSGTNYLGGYFVSGADMGKDLAVLTANVLTRGFDKSPRFGITPSPAGYHINYEVFKSAGLDFSLLPPGTIFYNRDPSVWKDYGWEIFIVALITGLVITLLLILYYQKRNKLRYYEQVNRQMKKMTEELIVLRNKAEESNRLKTAFLANMSHEIRTPLNAIVGFSNLIAHTEDREQIEEFCRIVKVNNEMLLQLITDILDLSKMEAGQLDFVYSDADVVAIFSYLEHTYRNRTRPGVTLECILPDPYYIIHTEKNRITQVLINFLTNAIKFTASGRIRMGYEHTEDGLRFFVEDTGPGIAKENLPYVFARFAKFDNFAQGTGLGLSLCENIIKALNGKIGVASQKGKGSVFWFVLPGREKRISL